MNSPAPHAYYLNAMGLCCPLGGRKDEIASHLFSDGQVPENLAQFLTAEKGALQDGPGYYLGRVTAPLPPIPEKFERYASRNNQLLLAAFSEIEPQIRAAIVQYGANRIAVILGTSTSGIAEGEEALLAHKKTGAFPEGYNFGVQEIADGSEFLAAWLGLSNLAVTVSTACSSSAKVFAQGAEMMDAGMCDAVIVGGADSLCQMTVNGFHSLGALSDQRCNPFSKNRTGISIGEGGALFLMSKEPSSIRLMSVGESSDGYSMTAPEPEGRGAKKSMLSALSEANLEAGDIAYVNLHGTGTPHNDSMESKAVSRVFGDEIACSTSKSIIGHTLGAAGAVEIALCWLMLSPHYNPKHLTLPHLWDGEPGDDITLKHFAAVGESLCVDRGNLYVLSNFFAFGGSNASVILKLENNDRD